MLLRRALTVAAMAVAMLMAPTALAADAETTMPTTVTPPTDPETTSPPTTTTTTTTTKPVTTAPKKVSPKDHIQYKIRNGEVASQAVNLGGWLLTEYWMSYNSTLYAGVPPETALKGEYHVMKLLGRDKGDAAFEGHWKTWITEKDIAEIAASGLNTVRVSTGFYIVNDVDDSQSTAFSKSFPRGALKYLDKLINVWALKYNLAVMVSLHAHEGSQNGNDHSLPLEFGKVTWGQTPESIASSLLYAKTIAHRYKNSPAFLGLNLMNEPNTGVDQVKLEKYYTDAYEAIRADGNDCIIGTSPLLPLQGPGSMDSFMPCPTYYNVWHEFHVYFKWGWANVNKQGIINGATAYATSHFDPWKGNPVFLGEWSLATDDTVKLTDADLTDFGTAHMKSAEAAPVGWAFWAWRHDDETTKTSGWSMRQLLRKKILTLPAAHAPKPKNPACPEHIATYNGTESSSNSSGSGSGTGSKAQVKPIELYKPEGVKAADTDAGNATIAPSASKSGVAPTSEAARALALVSMILATTLLY